MDKIDEQVELAHATEQLFTYIGMKYKSKEALLGFLANFTLGAREKDVLINCGGLGNPIMLQVMLYLMLVVPKENLSGTTAAQSLSNEFNQINNWLDNELKNSTDGSKILIWNYSDRNYVHHIRNAVAHSKIQFSSNNCWILEDQNPNNSSHNMKVQLSLKIVSELLTKLDKSMANYINSGNIASTPTV